MPNPMTRSAVVALATAGSMLLVGCGDADSVALAYYMRNLSDQAFEYEITSSEGVYARGEVNPEPASIGCGKVPDDWVLTVWPAGDVDRDGEPVTRLSAEEIGPVDPAVVWVNVNPVGQVQTGLGLPGWWGADIQRCP